MRMWVLPLALYHSPDQGSSVGVSCSVGQHCSSNETPSLRTSVCHRYSPKKKKKNGLKTLTIVFFSSCFLPLLFKIHLILSLLQILGPSAPSLSCCCFPCPVLPGSLALAWLWAWINLPPFFLAPGSRRMWKKGLSYASETSSCTEYLIPRVWLEVAVVPSILLSTSSPIPTTIPLPPSSLSSPTPSLFIPWLPLYFKDSSPEGHCFIIVSHDYLQILPLYWLI